jgi:hypothetical protein
MLYKCSSACLAVLETLHGIYIHILKSLIVPLPKYLMLMSGCCNFVCVLVLFVQGGGCRVRVVTKSHSANVFSSRACSSVCTVQPEEHNLAQLLAAQRAFWLHSAELRSTECF